MGENGSVKRRVIFHRGAYISLDDMARSVLESRCNMKERKYDFSFTFRKIREEAERDVYQLVWDTVRRQSKETRMTERPT